jgi:hypothetical protein|tara:strand:+ start:1522 stop:1734 length:213 start_codon:yes stop_codon:yes gene_type:complete
MGSVKKIGNQEPLKQKVGRELTEGNSREYSTSKKLLLAALLLNVPILYNLLLDDALGSDRENLKNKAKTN